MEELWGIPAHPLFVHIPVVAIPLLAAAAWLVAARADWRQRYSLPLLAGALVTMVATILAAESGEPLKEALQPGIGTRIDRHQQLGEQTTVFTILFFVGVTGTAVGDWLVRQQGRGEPAGGSRQLSAVRALAVGAAVLGTLAAVWVIRTGHEGARVTWTGIEFGS